MDSICLVGNSLRPMATLDSVYGYDIAANDTLNAIINYGGFKKIQMIVEPKQYQGQAITRKIKSIQRHNSINCNIETISEYDILYGLDITQHIQVMHNVGSEFMSPLHYRNRNPQNNFPFTYTIHGASYPYYIDSFYLMKLLMPFRPYDSLICTSQAVKNAVMKIIDTLSEALKYDRNIDLKCKCRMDVIPLGVDTKKFKPQPKELLRDKMCIPRDCFVMLWVGRFSAYDKANLMPLITVYKRLLEKKPAKKLLLILAGHDRKNSPVVPQMQKYINSLGISEKVLLMLNHELKDRHELIALADVFVSPADNVQETFGITPIEAMACGVPQVVSDWNGYKETVVDGETGFRIPTYWMKCDEDICKSITFPSEPMRRSAVHHLLQSQSVAVDLKMLEQRLELLIDNPKLCFKMGENSRKIACEKFDWKHIIKMYLQLWEELILQSRKNNEVKYDKSDFLVMPYHEAFSHYATRDLQEDEILVETTQGKMLRMGQWSRPLCYDIEFELREYNCFLRLLNLLSQVDNGLTIKDIQIQLSGIFTRPIIRRAVLYALKHGFADIVTY